MEAATLATSAGGSLNVNGNGAITGELAVGGMSSFGGDLMLNGHTLVLWVKGISALNCGSTIRAGSKSGSAASAASMSTKRVDTMVEHFLPGANTHDCLRDVSLEAAFVIV